MRWLEALMKSLWGTDALCNRDDQRAAGDKMVAEAERKVDQLNATLDDHPPRNLDETLFVMTRQRGR